MSYRVLSQEDLEMAPSKRSLVFFVLGHAATPSLDTFSEALGFYLPQTPVSPPIWPSEVVLGLPFAFSFLLKPEGTSFLAP
jgi:hypothetical protein